MNRQTVTSSKRSAAKGSTIASTYYYERGYAPAGTTKVGLKNTSRSEPDVAWLRSVQKPSVTQQSIVSSKGMYRTQRSTSQFLNGTTAPPLSPSMYAVNGTGQARAKSQFIYSTIEVPKSPLKPLVTESTSRSKLNLESNRNSTVADLTMKEAVEYLASKDETYQHCGASYIQHNTFIDDKAKEQVLKLNGIPPLVGLLRSPSLQVSLTASAALRNLSYKSDKNKEEIQRCMGVTEASALLRDTDSAELRKQLTGLLWNLSSADNLKADLLKNALPVLMESVILPRATGPDESNGNSQESDVFLHTTACLRNLSSSKQSNRQTLRKCRGLVDSLVAYLKDSLEAEDTDGDSVENCVCILHNLTFQLQAEAPALFNRITALVQTVNSNQSQGEISPIGCFSSQNKSPEQERTFDFPVVEDPQPSGAGWLIHSKTLQTYLSLLGSSKREETQEACCGALQNLTTNEGIVSDVMSQTIVQKLNGLRVLTPLLKSDKVNLQRSAVSLVGNLTKNPNLHSAIARKALPDLLGLITKGTSEGNESDDTLAVACRTAGTLLLSKPEMSKNLLNNNLIKSLTDLSQNIYFPKSSKAASLLLYKLWSDKDLQSFVKKRGMTKSSFVNDTTMAAHRSVQVVD
ncbi:plakophilin-1 isoform X2 [Mugil cephalus]|nr:plakophilin-1 isoform X2 [Mugil cephalus]